MNLNSHGKIWESSPAIRILAFFFENPSPEFFGAEIVKKTGLSAGAVHKYLALLYRDGLLDRRKVGRMNFFVLNRRNPATRHLKIAYTISSLPMQVLANAARNIEGIEVFLYGSAARGEDDEKSDWDIMVLGNAEKTTIRHIVAHANNIAHPRVIKAYSFSHKEWAAMQRGDPAFYESVEKDKIRLV